MYIRDLNDKQRETLQKICRDRLKEYKKQVTNPVTTLELNLWDKAFSEGARAILAMVDKLNV